MAISDPALCGPTRHGFRCVLPRGHNMGQADVPENHATDEVDPELDALIDAIDAVMGRGDDPRTYADEILAAVRNADNVRRF